MNYRHIIIGTIFLAIAMIGAYTFYQVYTRHMDLTVMVVEKRITEAANQCIWDEVCKTYPVTLGSLIEKNYLKEEVNPITKLYYSHDSYVDLQNFNFCD